VRTHRRARSWGGSVRAGKELANDMEEVVKEGDEGALGPKDGVAVGI
jgi:hypothetical protein